MTTDAVQLHWIWRETSNRLDVLHRRVQEGRDVMAASEFARWLNFSGIIKLLEANAQDAPLKVDGALLRSKCEIVLAQCNDRFRTNSEDPNLAKAELLSIHEKLDTLAGYVSRLSAPAVAVERSEPIVPERPRLPELRVPDDGLVVIPGGLDDGESTGRNGKQSEVAEAHRNGAEAVA